MRRARLPAQRLAEKKAFALEVLDNLCERRGKDVFMIPLVEGPSAEDVWRELKGQDQQRVTRQGRSSSR